MTETEQATRCQGCGRKLTAARSVAAGRGRRCRAKVREAAASVDLTAFHGWQVAKAAEAIEAQAVIPLSRPGMYAAVSGDGTTTYIVDVLEGSCTCKAAANGRRCYHLAAAIILNAASTRRAA